MRLFPRIYDMLMAPWERGRLGRYRHDVFAPARGRVIEIGAGTGLNFPHYQRGAFIVATDSDTGMLHRARSRARWSKAEILLVAADAEALPLRDAAFDEAVVGLALCTIPHPERALGELRRALRPGGSVRMLEHVRIERPAIIGRAQDWLTPVWRRIAGGCRLNRRTLDMVREAGFEGIDTKPHVGGYLQEIVGRKPA